MVRREQTPSGPAAAVRGRDDVDAFVQKTARIVHEMEAHVRAVKDHVESRAQYLRRSALAREHRRRITEYLRRTGRDGRKGSAARG